MYHQGIADYIIQQNNKTITKFSTLVNAGGGVPHENVLGIVIPRVIVFGLTGFYGALELLGVRSIDSRSVERL